MVAKKIREFASKLVTVLGSAGVQSLKSFKHVRGTCFLLMRIHNGLPVESL